jgi:hypothetical protein
MYLPDAKADELDKLYERLDGRSKIAGEESRNTLIS